MSKTQNPDFNNLLKVLRREEPDRPTLFDFFHNEPLYTWLAGSDCSDVEEKIRRAVLKIRGFHAAGYDYATAFFPGFGFPTGGNGERKHMATHSLNDGGIIADRESFDAYPWPDVADADFASLEALEGHLPEGMKLIVMGPMGLEENVISLVGYESLCYMMADDEDLVGDIFAGVGSRLVEIFGRVSQYDFVGACISNDDWGFKTSSLLSMGQMQQFLFPWHKKMADAIHAAGKPAILHSCGAFEHLVDIIADDIGYDARHSYEDAILPVEEAYEKYHTRFAILGGIDMDFICRSTPEEVYRRSKAMLERVQGRGGYALGTGNSVPAYVPRENYLAMIRAATESR